MNQAININQSLVISYLGLRKSIGLIATALPFVLAIGYAVLESVQLLSSMSAYYHTIMGDVFVGSLFAIAVFLMSYRGYELKDDLAGDIACAFAIGVALFPTAPNLTPTTQESIFSGLHLVSATGFFLTLAYFSIVLFRKTDPSKTPTPRKKLRNTVYLVSGIIMITSISTVAMIGLLPMSLEIGKLNPVYWAEVIATLAFGVAWLIKGKALLKDTKVSSAPLIRDELTIKS